MAIHIAIKIVCTTILMITLTRKPRCLILQRRFKPPESAAFGVRAFGPLVPSLGLGQQPPEVLLGVAPLGQQLAQHPRDLGAGDQRLIFFPSPAPGSAERRWPAAPG